MTETDQKSVWNSSRCRFVRLGAREEFHPAVLTEDRWMVHAYSNFFATPRHMSRCGKLPQGRERGLSHRQTAPGRQSAVEQQNDSADTNEKNKAGKTDIQPGKPRLIGLVVRHGIVAAIAAVPRDLLDHFRVLLSR